MTRDQFNKVLWEIVGAQMALADGCLDAADLQIISTMDLLKEITGYEWPDWLTFSGERLSLPKRVSLKEVDLLDGEL